MLTDKLISKMFTLAWSAGVLALAPSESIAQCGTLLDGDGVATENPVYFECNDGSGTFEFWPLTEGTWTDVTVDWGDGTAPEFFAEWSETQAISHNYVYEAHASYVITVSNSTCSATATLEKSVLVNPSIVVPQGWPTGACAPATLSFVNGSTNVTPDTEFAWSFDDGTTVVAGPENEGATVDHLYAAFTTGCQREVTLTATNACRTAEFGVPAAVTIDYINIWDRDNPSIDASATVLCWPENTVDLRNVSEKVCLANGNTEQRKEKWDFGGPYGPNGLSQIDWRPWINSNPLTLTFPGVGVYTISLAVENYCGIDEESITIVVREPLTAALTGPAEACEGESMNFQATAPESEWFEWDFYGTDQIWYSSSTGNMTWAYNTPGTYEMAVKVGLNGQSESCTAIANHLVEVKEKPRAEISLSETEGCESLNVIVEEVHGEGDSYTWTWPENANIIATPGVILAQLTELGTHVFSVEVAGTNGCKRVANATAEVFPSPEADFTSGAVCEGNASPFTDLSLPGGSDALSSWAWSFGDQNASDERHPNHTYDEAGVYTVTLEVSDGHCTGSASQDIVVNASPDLAVNSNAVAGCSPLEVQFEATSDGSVVWEFGDDNGDSGISVSHVYYGVSTEGSQFDVVATSVNEFGCISEAFLAIETLPSAQAAIAVSPAACSPYAPEFTNNSDLASHYLWTFEGGDTSDEVEPTRVFVNETEDVLSQTIQLVAYAENGCHDTTSVAITVLPEARFELSLDQTEACSPFSFIAPTVPGAENHTWTFGDGSSSSVPNPVHVYENAGEVPMTYPVTLEAQNSFGCAGTAQTEIIVNPSPVADFTADIQSGCAPLTVTFEESSERAIAFAWNYGDANTAEGFDGESHSHTFDLIGFELATRAVTLTVEAEGGCTDSHTLAVEVYPEVRAVPAGELEGCAPWQADLVAEGYASANNHSVAWTIDGEELFEGAALQRTFAGLEGADQEIPLQLSVTSPYGCTADSSFMATVHHMPVAQFELDQAGACAGTEVAFTDQSMFADVVTLEWGQGEDPVTSPESIHIFANDGYEPLTVELVQTATTNYGCVDQAFVNHTVYPKVTAAFLPPVDACAPFEVALVNQSANANGTFTWNFGDGSPVSHSAQPLHVFDTPADVSSEYLISLHATSTYGCADSTSHTLEVHATPVADLEVVEQVGCYPVEVTFANQSVGGDTYTWTYGTGLNSQESAAEHTVQYFNPSANIVTYAAVLTATTEAGCSSQDVAYIEVLPEIEAHFEGTAAGCAPLEVDFLNLSDGASSYSWNFGDGDQSSTSHPNHVFMTEPGQDATYTVTLVAESVYGCTDTAEIAVHVFAQPVADFATSSTQLTFPESVFGLTNLSVASESATHFWTFGDGQVSYDANPDFHEYSTWGTYDITLEVDNGHCASVVNSAVQILAPQPTIGFTGEGSGCAPLTVQFDNLSTYASSYRWEFSDGSVRSDDSPAHTFNEPGLYNVTLYVEGFEGTELTETHTAVVEVFPTAQAAFTLNPNHVMVPGQPVYFLNLSDAATEFAWDFGDGSSSSVADPIHEYQEPGLYDITLMANNEWGCSTTYVLPEAVLAEAGGSMVFPNAFTPSSTGPNGGYYDPSSYDNDVFRPLHAGVETYEMMVFTKWGEMIFYTDDVRVGWDGYIQGKLAPTDVYAWKATATLSDGQTLHQLGNVTLLAR